VIEHINLASVVLVITIIGFACYVALTILFLRVSSNRIIHAVAIFFGLSAALFLGLVLAESVFTELANPTYARWRAVTFRGCQTAAALWLLWTILRRRRGPVG